MSQETGGEGALRKSLDSIDGIRRRILLGGYLAVAGTFLAFLWLDHVARTSSNIKSVLMASVLALTFVIAWSTFALAVLVLRMTRRVLRAIDFATKTWPLDVGGE
jgi:hypothetical protein